MMGTHIARPVRGGRPLQRSPSPASLLVPIRAEGGLLSKERRRRQLAADRRSRRRGSEAATMAAGEQTPATTSPARAETILRGACAAMAAAAAMLMGLSAQTKTVLFVQRRAVPKDVQALWVMIVTASAAAGYHVVQLARCLYMSHLAAGGGGCRRLRRRVACVSFLLDKVRTVQTTPTPHAFALPRSAGSLFPDNQEDRACPVPNRFHLNASLSLSLSLCNLAFASDPYRARSHTY
ncbi:hypothetical protein HU200_000268 [Digitaria exilis]|uniref:CASP-like protein n=1 Tax=Digitaria exilis TaxID=1010633 RepID=A0A835L177_9POAL|nr:hypothetical protein HU200_000268 [Digitaria exilis]